MNNTKPVIIGVLALLTLIVFSIFNPFSWNDAGHRSVIEQASGTQFVRFQPGIYYAGFFAKVTEWPNQLSISYRSDTPELELTEGNTIEMGKINIRFNDATTADISGIVQYVMPYDESEMIEMHNAHRTPLSLVSKRLAPYTKECLQSSAQLMSAEMHYGGGRAQMSQDFGDQLKQGVFILKIEERMQFDSLSKEVRKVYETLIQKDKSGEPKRKVSSITEYGITVADAAITDVDYEDKVDQLLAKKIDAATKASVAKQELITAQQQQETAKAKGEQALTEIEYQQRQEQTKLVVAAETQVKLAEQDKVKQKIAMEAAELEARKLKTLADAEAYAKQKVMAADGALDKKLEAWMYSQEVWANAFKEYKGNVTPTTVMGGNGHGGNAAVQFMEIMGAKAAMDLSLDLKNKK
jgi:hypothetical protein